MLNKNISQKVLNLTCGILISLFSNSLIAETPTEQGFEPSIITYPNFNTVGRATMRWLWFQLYEAELNTPSGLYKSNASPLTLKLTYKKNIDQDSLIGATIKEWKRMNTSFSTQWLTTLKEIWPDVTPGDQLLLHIDNNGQSHFFFNEKFIGTLQDEKFSSSFISIWLSDNTLKPKLRNKLIGLQP